MDAFQKHYEYFHIPYIYETVVKVDRDPEFGYITTTSDGTVYQSCAVLIATGTKYSKLGVAGEEEFHGRGVSYCATCDGPFFREKNVIVVGGSDSAAVEALYLAKLANKVTIVYRRDKIHPEPINMHRCENDPKIEILTNTILSEIQGNQIVTGVRLGDGTEIPVDGVFIEIGSDPNTEMVKNLGIELNEKGEIVVDVNAQTNIPGLFAAGDVTQIREKQVLCAAGQTVTAAYSIRDFMEKNFCD